ncbi:MAG: GNAT family N-acetyltransferase [Acidobacteriota bacterium]|nr:GNAT family N-acetyltransferase [Acidobacteriota bacterium]
MTRPAIREATPADACAIGEVHVRSWRESYRGLVPDEALTQLDPESCAADWQIRLLNLTPPACCFVSVDDAGQVTGFIHAGPARDFDLAAGAEVYAIYLLAHVKRQGVGRALMLSAASRMREAGFRSLCLWFLRGNPAQAFYERFGGRVGIERPYSRFGFTLPSLGCAWNDIDALIAALDT